MIKRIKIKSLSISMFAIFLLVSGISCTKNSDVDTPVVIDTNAVYLSNLREYKKSNHQIMAAYFRTWRDKAAYDENITSMKDLPDSLDIAFVFPDFTPAENPFWDSLKNVYVPHLRERGTKVVITADINIVLNKDFPNTEIGYADLAKKIIADQVTKYDLDGLDIDVERSLSAEELQRAAGVFKALSNYIGPKSNTGKLFIYDTNQNGNTPLFSAVNTFIDYVLVQSYGRNVNGLQSTFDSYADKVRPSQYLIGFSFYEERGAYWGDVLPPIQQSRAFNYARWNPSQGTKGGIFSYAVDRDGVLQGQDNIVDTKYLVTRQLISLMNPPKK